MKSHLNQLTTESQLTHYVQSNSDFLSAAAEKKITKLVLIIFSQTRKETSNATTVTEVWSASARLFAGMWRPLVSVITTLYYVANGSSMVSHAFSALCVYSKFGHHPHPTGYLCVKFCFFRDFHGRASPWRKIAYLITHSLNHSPSLLDAPGTKTLAKRNANFQHTFIDCASTSNSLVVQYKSVITDCTKCTEQVKMNALTTKLQTTYDNQWKQTDRVQALQISSHQNQVCRWLLAVTSLLHEESINNLQQQLHSN